MALKDWKKVSKDTKHLQWHNFKKNISVFVYLQDYNPEAYGYKKKSTWDFNIQSRDMDIVDKSYKTKTLAIKSAKRYMRNH